MEVLELNTPALADIVVIILLTLYKPLYLFKSLLSITTSISLFGLKKVKFVLAIEIFPCMDASFKADAVATEESSPLSTVYTCVLPPFSLVDAVDSICDTSPVRESTETIFDPYF